MPSVVEEIPERLQPAADAALAWINVQQGAQFRITGLVDPDAALAGSLPESRWTWASCCAMAISVSASRYACRAVGDGYEVSGVEAGAAEIPVQLDPPVGIRREWLDKQLEKHEFILLLYYRGLW